MADLSPIILGGGISAGTPFTLGAIPRVTSVTPPTVADSLIFQRLQSATQVITVGTNSFPLATETVQVIGGLISDNGANDNVLLGRGASARAQANAQNVVIGTNAVSNNSVNATQNTLVGFNVQPLIDVGNLVFLGSNITCGAGAVTAGAIMIGNGMTPTNSASGPCIGAGANQQGSGVLIGNQSSTSPVNNYVCIGRSAQENAGSCVVIGDTCRAGAGHTFSVLIGRNVVSIAAHTLHFGAAGGAEISQVLIGEGDTAAAPIGVSYRHTNASGNNAQGGNVDLVASLGTGNALTQGRLRFRTGAPSGVAAALQVSTIQVEILPSAGGAAAPNINIANVTNGAAAAAGTLLNSPVAGNPTFWVPISINGVQKFMPAW